MKSQAAVAARIAVDQPPGRVAAALRLRAEDRVAEALELLSKPGEYAQDVYTLRGDLQLELGLLHEAVGSYSTVVAVDPENIHAHQNLAGCLRQLGRWRAAAEAFQKLLDRDAYSDAARIGLGECLLHLDQPEEALACFEKCWSKAALLAALFGKAAALQSLRRFDESEALYVQLLELHPDAEEALRNLIALSLEIFDLARVECYAHRLVKAQPDSVVGLQALVVVAFERRSYESAADYYGRLLETIPEKQLFQGGNGDAFEYRLSRKTSSFCIKSVAIRFRRRGTEVTEVRHGKIANSSGAEPGRRGSSPAQVGKRHRRITEVPQPAHGRRSYR